MLRAVPGVSPEDCGSPGEFSPWGIHVGRGAGGGDQGVVEGTAGRSLGRKAVCSESMWVDT